MSAAPALWTRKFVASALLDDAILIVAMSSSSYTKL